MFRRDTFGLERGTFASMQKLLKNRGVMTPLNSPVPTSLFQTNYSLQVFCLSANNKAI